MVLNVLAVLKERSILIYIYKPTKSRRKYRLNYNLSVLLSPFLGDYTSDDHKFQASQRRDFRSKDDL